MRDYDKQFPNPAVLEDDQRGHQNVNKLMPQDGKVYAVADSGTKDTDFTVVVDLKDANGVARIPTGYFAVAKSKAGDVYTGSGTWTTTALYLRCTVDNVALSILAF